MAASRRILYVVCAALSAGACSNFIADLPPDFALPMQEILLQSACELQDALWDLNREEYAKFRATRWLISISLTPKADTDLSVSLGGTRKVPTTPNALRVTTWALGLPGLQADYKSARTGGVTFNFLSNRLLDDRHLPCDKQTASIHVLAQNLGVGKWLRRMADAVNLTPSGVLDKNSYKTDITIKFTAAGSYTYLFPPGTDIVTPSGFYELDEELLISMTALAEDKKPITAITLPRGDNFLEPGLPSTFTASTASIEDARIRLDLTQVEQAIRSLRTSP